MIVLRAGFEHMSMSRAVGCVVTDRLADSLTAGTVVRVWVCSQVRADVTQRHVHEQLRAPDLLAVPALQVHHAVTYHTHTQDTPCAETSNIECDAKHKQARCPRRCDYSTAGDVAC